MTDLVTAAAGNITADSSLNGEHRHLALGALTWHRPDIYLQQEALNATAGQYRPDQGGPQRIHSAYGTGGLACVLHGVEVADHNKAREASDHSLLILRFDRVSLERVLSLPLSTAHTAGTLR
ncbi:hypothetical protein [Streptomyces sp. NPDC048002]|uniref:hypothetical protein n=1 Tax=Streptomyces sp. NPDC048002 TaxID=3154344 RepID=UPI0033D08491